MLPEHHGLPIFTRGVPAVLHRRPMQATVGDRLQVPGAVVQNEDTGPITVEVIDVLGEHGAPPYLVRFPDGRETLVFAGPDDEVERPRSRPRLSRRFVG